MISSPFLIFAPMQVINNSLKSLYVFPCVNFLFFVPKTYPNVLFSPLVLASQVAILNKLLKLFLFKDIVACQSFLRELVQFVDGVVGPPCCEVVIVKSVIEDVDGAPALASSLLLVVPLVPSVVFNLLLRDILYVLFKNQYVVWFPCGQDIFSAYSCYKNTPPIFV